MKINIVIFGKDQEIAEKIMSDMIFTWEEPVIHRTKDSVETETKYVRAMKWSNSRRGFRAHKLYIDRRIDPEEVELCIIPRLIPKITSDDYSWKDHVKYF